MSKCNINHYTRARDLSAWHLLDPLAQYLGTSGLPDQALPSDPSQTNYYRFPTTTHIAQELIGTGHAHQLHTMVETKMSLSSVGDFKRDISRRSLQLAFLAFF